MSDELLDDSFLGANIEIDDLSFGAQYALIQWVNGKPTGAKGTIQQTGGFFISGDSGVEPPPMFKPFTFMTNEGKEIEGFAADNLKISPIRFRKVWEVSSGENDSRPVRFAQDEYEAAKAYAEKVGHSVRGLGHLIVGLEGSEDPYMITFRGNASAAVLSLSMNNPGAVSRFGNKVCGGARHLAQRAKRGGNKNYPLCTFQMTLGPTLDDKGKPQYVKVGQGSNVSSICLPTWTDEISGVVTQDILNRLFVGHERFTLYQQWYKDAESWANAWLADNLRSRDAADNGADDVSVTATKEAVPGAQETPF